MLVKIVMSRQIFPCFNKVLFGRVAIKIIKTDEEIMFKLWIHHSSCGRCFGVEASNDLRG